MQALPGLDELADDHSACLQHSWLARKGDLWVFSIGSKSYRAYTFELNCIVWNIMKYCTALYREFIVLYLREQVPKRCDL